jgi:MFS family permease
VGEGMTAPAIPLLGSNFGASYSLIGFFMTGYSVAYGIMTILSGRFSDIFGRKKFFCSVFWFAFWPLLVTALPVPPMPC